MSRVGKRPIPLPDKAKFELSGQRVSVTGPKGSLARVIHSDMTVALENGEIVVTRPSDAKTHRALHGLTRALINNMVIGVTKGYVITLKMIGVGYRAEMKGKSVVLHLGYSHPIVFLPPDGVNFEILPKEGIMKLSSIDKELVGQVAAKIRSFRPPEPYKGKGVRYIDEIVKTKAGKSAGA